MKAGHRKAKGSSKARGSVQFAAGTVQCVHAREIPVLDTPCIGTFLAGPRATSQARCLLRESIWAAECFVTAAAFDLVDEI